MYNGLNLNQFWCFLGSFILFLSILPSNSLEFNAMDPDNQSESLFQTLYGVMVGRNNTVFIVGTLKSPEKSMIQRRTWDGIMLDSWHEGIFGGPLAVDSNDQVYAIEYIEYEGFYISQFASNGTLLHHWPAQFREVTYSPGSDLKINPNGELAVSAGEWIETYSINGTWLCRWSFNQSNDFIDGIAFDNAANLYIASGKHPQVYKYFPSNSQDTTWKLETSSKAELKGPGALACDGTNLYITDYVDNYVRIFSLDGTYIRRWGGGFFGDLDNPGAVDIDDKGRVFVVDGGSDLVHVFNQMGTELAKWPENGTSSKSETSPTKGTASKNASTKISGLGFAIVTTCLTLLGGYRLKNLRY